MSETKSPERVDGPTPNGCTYSIAYFHDDLSMEIVEFDAADRAIHRTYSPPRDDRGRMIEMCDFTEEDLAIMDAIRAENAREEAAKRPDLLGGIK
jgi:hypothetical protein